MPYDPNNVETPRWNYDCEILFTFDRCTDFNDLLINPFISGPVPTRIIANTIAADFACTCLISFTEAPSKDPTSFTWSVQYDMPTNDPEIGAYYIAYFSPIV